MRAGSSRLVLAALVAGATGVASAAGAGGAVEAAGAAGVVGLIRAASCAGSSAVACIELGCAARCDASPITCTTPVACLVEPPAEPRAPAQVARHVARVAPAAPPPVAVLTFAPKTSPPSPS